jgi:hypothetical protein
LFPSGEQQKEQHEQGDVGSMGERPNQLFEQGENHQGVSVIGEGGSVMTEL